LRIAVVDSSPLIFLTHLNLASELSLFFDKVYVPRSVQREVNRKGRFRYRLNKLYRTGFFVRCLVADTTNVDLLKAELGEGESEGIIQAQENYARYFLADDSEARETAARMGTKPVGTLRLLARLSLEGRASELTTLVRILRRDLGLRASDEVIQQAIAAAPEPI
jgi:predicted nucleic acid-binding protein